MRFSLTLIITVFASVALAQNQTPEVKEKTEEAVAESETQQEPTTEQTQNKDESPSVDSTSEVNSDSSTNPKMAAQDFKKVEKLEVTGSHIKRIDVEGPSPVLVIDKEDLVRSGYNSVSDVLRDAGVSSFGSFREVGGQQGAGSAAVDLRGLGQVRTLVLLDGKRLPSDAINGSVDMNIIPMAAVERIDVLKDGASAIYGSDALGGVVNIITKKEFSGHELGGSFSFAELKGGERRDLSYTTGYNTSKLRWINVLFFRHNERIEGRNRDWSKNNYSFTGSPGSYSTDGGTTFKTDPSCDPSAVYTSGTKSYCLYNFGQDKWEMPYIKQASILSQASYDFTDQITGIARLSYIYKEVDWVHSPASASNFTMLAGGPAELGSNGDNGVPITNIRYRFRELGNRTSNTKSNVGSALVGLKGYAGDTWDWQTSLSVNKIDQKERRQGYALKADIQSAIDNNLFNPFGLEGQRGDLSGLLYEPQQDNISENTFLEMKATGEVGELGAGPVSLAMGSQFLRELYRDSADDRTLNGEVMDLASSSGGGDRNSVSVFSEMGFQFFKSLETLAALRYDHFEGFGGTVNPKLSFRYNATKAWMFRASAGTGFKAPQMQNLFATQTTAQLQFIDHVACNQNGGADCTRQSYNVLQGGNTRLKEETSFSFNLGTMYQPVKAHSVGIDFWYYNLNDLVQAPDFQALTLAESQGVDITKYGAVANRDPVTQKLIGGGLEASFLNIASTETQGIDFNYFGKVQTSVGDFKIRFEHSQMLYYKTESLPGTGITDRVGDYGRPRFRNNTTLFYIPNQRNEYSVLIRTIDQNAKSVAAAGKHPLYTEYDFRYSLAIDSLNGKLTFGIKNLLGTRPPFDDPNVLDPDLNSSLYDGRGRTVYLGYRQSF